ncbi:MAG: flagellar export chaperone FliS [Alphaproteobacteria bacterium CG1_02_46_17]|nr:MAG: flagellar export chaperone FliS [Alphaproteobacteria bacterium CG1_02_46_17]
MAVNPYQKASQAYQKKSDENLTPLQIVVELYKGMLRNTKIAKQSWKEGRLDVMSNHIIKTFDIIEALQGNLDLENGGEDARFLNRFYTVIFSSLSQATAKPNPGEYFDEIIAYIQQVHDRWYAIAYGLPPSADEETQEETQQ